LPELETLEHNLMGSVDFPYPPKLASLNDFMQYRNYKFKEVIEVSPLDQHKETAKYISERK